eukprot:3763481-Pyramimonas_sp.AAC.1
MSAREEEHGPPWSKNLPTQIMPSPAWMRTATRLRLRSSVLLPHAGGPQVQLRQTPTSRRPPRGPAGGDASHSAP